MMSTALAQISQLLDPRSEPFYKIYREHLIELNRIVKNLGEPLEGNLFYLHQDPELQPWPCKEFLIKRRSLALFAMTKHDVLEIGFNAGHSALLMLAANPDICVVSVDPCYHNYSQPCFEYLRSQFGNRIDLIPERSSVIWKTLDAKRFDGFHIDGNHVTETASQDMENCIRNGTRGSVIVFDDSDNLELRLMLELYMLSGQVINISDQNGNLPNSNQMFFINNKSDT